ncbi:invasion associated locus B family protein [Bartonella sp. F02]|uniref:invasion associated locus B family protein n=1 Tax=Bartonella sp. F02 TaxID=2967262 RepID=UPI0022A9512F|nr:invasion associated locus B family protein [Bartonella sp. F02]MCZ2328400.1 invasion associated locus B family protein [Bartonella sp. F02]
MKKLLSFCVISAFLSFPFSAFAQNAKPPAATLPNGASSLSETYGLWSVNCGIQEDRKVCFINRQEVNDQNRIVLAMNLVLNSDGMVSGELVVPFNILVSKPINLQVDDGKAIIETSIRTCVPTGCIVPVAFDKNFVTALRSGKRLKLVMTAAIPGEPTLNDFFVQLNGFSNALNRLAALQK